MDGKRILDIIMAARTLSDDQLVKLIKDMMGSVPRSFSEASAFVESAKRDTDRYRTNEHGSDIHRKFEDDTELPSFIQIGHLGITFTYMWGTSSKVMVRYPPHGDAIFVSSNAISGNITPDYVTFNYEFGRGIPAAAGSARVMLKNGKITAW